MQAKAVAKLVLNNLGALPILFQPNTISADITIPNGCNCLMIGPFETSPDITVTGEGNSTWTGI